MDEPTTRTEGIANQILELSTADVDGPTLLPAEGRFKVVPAGGERLRFKTTDLDASALEFTAGVGAVEAWLADGLATVVDAPNARTYDAPEWARA